MLPVDAPFGTVAVMLVSLHLLAVAVVALNFTVLVPCMAPKFDPVMITEVATAPEFGFEPVIVTAGGVIGGVVGVDGEPAPPQPATHTKARHASPARCFNPYKTFDFKDVDGHLFSRAIVAEIGKCNLRALQKSFAHAGAVGTFVSARPVPNWTTLLTKRGED